MGERKCLMNEEGGGGGMEMFDGWREGEMNDWKEGKEREVAQG
jgi:hypothetical protein